MLTEILQNDGTPHSHQILERAFPYTAEELIIYLKLFKSQLLRDTSNSLDTKQIQGYLRKETKMTPKRQHSKSTYSFKEILLFRGESCICIAPSTNYLHKEDSKTVNICFNGQTPPNRVFWCQITSAGQERKYQYASKAWKGEPNGGYNILLSENKCRRLPTRTMHP